MSLLLGSPSERLTLPQAVDSLGDAARRAGRPSWLWIAGAFYPGLNLNFDLLRGVLALGERFSGVDLPWAGDVGRFLTLFAPGLPGVSIGPEGADDIGTVILTLPLLLLVCRLTAGLARVSDPLYAPPDVRLTAEGSGGETPRAARLREVWREGKGLALMALGLWGMLLLLLFGATLVLVGPVVALMKLLDLVRFSPLFAGLLLPALALVLVYAAVLMVLNQLALHSLAHNRRGVASALTHAWRLVRASPLGALRATLADFVIFVCLLAAEIVLGGVVRAGPPLGTLVLLALYGFAGVTRAGYWARTYRALGGLSAADRVPGL